jgi:hypothetical protein
MLFTIPRTDGERDRFHNKRDRFLTTKETGFIVYDFLPLLMLYLVRILLLDTKHKKKWILGA